MHQPTLFRNVRVFDGTTVRPTASVLVMDGLVTAVGTGLSGPDGTLIVEGHGRETLLPGLIDAHTHLLGDDPLGRAVALGVTTELSMGDDISKVADLKAAQDSPRGRAIADLRSAGASAKAPGSHAASGEHGHVPTISAPEDAEGFVAARVADGSDYIKMHYDDGQFYGRMVGRHLPFISKETMAAVATAAHGHGKLAIVHVGTLQAARDAIEAGADALAHVFVDREPDEGIAALAAERGVFVISTLSIFEVLSGRLQAYRAAVAHSHLEPYVAREDLELARIGAGDAAAEIIHVEAAAAAIRGFSEAGVPLVAGTDAAAYLHGVGIHLELELLVRSGLSPVAALTAATSTTADRFSLTDRGRIAAGYRADLLLVDGDPTADILATRAVIGVWKRGEEAERRRRDEVEPAAIASASGRTCRSSGYFMQTSRGGKGDFALATGKGDLLSFLVRDNDELGFPWRQTALLPPASAPLTQPSVLERRDGSYGLAARAGDTLVTYAGSPDGTQWQGPTTVTVDDLPVIDITAGPALIEATPGGPYALELIAVQQDRLVHYRKMLIPGAGWIRSAELGTGGAVPLGVALVQHRSGARTAVVRMADATIAAYTTASARPEWTGPEPVTIDGAPIEAATGDPAILECAWSEGATLDLLVPEGYQVAHYRRSVDDDAAGWRLLGVLPAPWVAEGTYRPVAASLIQSVFNDPGNLEAVVCLAREDELTPDQVLAPYYFDVPSGRWHALRPAADGSRAFENFSEMWAAAKAAKAASADAVLDV